MVHFAHFLGIIKNHATFMAVDGLHTATCGPDGVSLQMQDVSEIREKPNYLFLDTGSPHHVQLVTGIEEFEVQHEGKRLRYSLYGETGSNINFVEQQEENTFVVRTYERGVEDETLSCGTGVTAVALAMHHLGKVTKEAVTLKTKGGELRVYFREQGTGYTDITLEGPVEQVFNGIISV